MLQGAVGVVYQPIERGTAQRRALQCWRLLNGRHREVNECYLCSIRIEARLEVRPRMQLRTSNYCSLRFWCVFVFLLVWLKPRWRLYWLVNLLLQARSTPSKTLTPSLSPSPTSWCDSCTLKTIDITYSSCLYRDKASMNSWSRTDCIEKWSN